MTTPQAPQPNPYPQQPYVPQQPPKKRKKWPWIVGAIVIVFIAIVAGCSALVGGVANEIDKAANSTATVTYRVTGPNSASITYSDKDFNMAQATQATLPWEQEVTLTGFGKLATLSATNDSDVSADQKITCEIVVNGAVKNTQTSTGPFATASCSYSVQSEDTEPSE